VKINTVGTRNKEQVGKRRIIPYCESFLYCESTSFLKLKFAKHQHSVIASYYTIAESLNASFDCISFKLYDLYCPWFDECVWTSFKLYFWSPSLRFFYTVGSRFNNTLGLPRKILLSRDLLLIWDLPYIQVSTYNSLYNFRLRENIVKSGSDCTIYNDKMM